MMQEKKKTIRRADERKTIINRLNRIKGQISGIEKIVLEDCYCNDLLVQIVAAEKSLKSLANVVLENHLYSCISNDLLNGNYDSLDEIISLFKRFND